ncbi:hypothetical protein JCM9957A_62670 [Kineosporia succinea]
MARKVMVRDSLLTEKSFGSGRSGLKHRMRFPVPRSEYGTGHTATWSYGAGLDCYDPVLIDRVVVGDGERDECGGYGGELSDGSGGATGRG